MEKETEKILIIKAGYTEVLDGETDSQKVSFGDIIRTTPLLHLYKKDHVTWATDEVAVPLLEGNPLISRLMKLDTWALQQLEAEYFDSVINLEKIPGICALTRKIDAWRKFGFRFDPRTGNVKAHDRATEVLGVSFNPEIKRENKKLFQELLFEMVGAKWNKEKYILGYQPRTQIEYDVCLNTQVGQKWPTKAWPSKRWDELEQMLVGSGYSVSRQDKMMAKMGKNLNSYMDWINSGRVIVSNDSLGLHLGLALDKKVIGLFGATPHREVYFYENGEALLPEPAPSCLPCFSGVCKREKNCIEEISSERVYKVIGGYLSR